MKISYDISKAFHILMAILNALLSVITLLKSYAYSNISDFGIMFYIQAD